MQKYVPLLMSIICLTFGTTWSMDIIEISSEDEKLLSYWDGYNKNKVCTHNVKAGDDKSYTKEVMFKTTKNLNNFSKINEQEALIQCYYAIAQQRLKLTENEWNEHINEYTDIFKTNFVFSERCSINLISPLLLRSATFFGLLIIHNNIELVRCILEGKLVNTQHMPDLNQPIGTSKLFKYDTLVPLEAAILLGYSDMAKLLAKHGALLDQKLKDQDNKIYDLTIRDIAQLSWEKIAEKKFIHPNTIWYNVFDNNQTLHLQSDPRIKNTKKSTTVMINKNSNGNLTQNNTPKLDLEKNTSDKRNVLSKSHFILPFIAGFINSLQGNGIGFMGLFSVLYHGNSLSNEDSLKYLKTGLIYGAGWLVKTSMQYVCSRNKIVIPIMIDKNKNYLEWTTITIVNGYMLYKNTF